jgi:hypothetical protein
MDTGLVIIIGAVLIFYLRLIILQRERARQAKHQSTPPSGKKGKNLPSAPAPRFSIVSQNKRDWIIAGIGVVLIIFGILLNQHIIPVPLVQTIWWLPIAIGIIAFSWGFR